MAIKRNNNIVLFLAFGIFATIAVILILNLNSVVAVRNEQHANENHVEAPSVRMKYRNGLCEATEIYYNQVFGTILVLCKMPTTDDLWGGLTFRVTENRDTGVTWLGDNAYECTVLVENRHYWNRVIDRGYVSFFSNDGQKYMWILDLFLDWYGM